MSTLRLLVTTCIWDGCQLHASHELVDIGGRVTGPFCRHHGHVSLAILEDVEEAALEKLQEAIDNVGGKL